LVVSEKAKSEWIVVPILKELMSINDKFFTVHSGENLSADVEKGLKGECDYIEMGIAQCAAQVVGAKIFNEKKGTPIKKLYGCVTNGDTWLFMRLEDDEIIIDTKKYQLANLPELLGTFQNIIDYYKEHLN